jgi:methionyl aminopeptidase
VKAVETMAKLEEQEAAAAVEVPQQDVDMAEAEHSGEVAADEPETSGKSKKKKKKHKKKKSKASHASAGSKLPPFRGVTGFTDSYVAVGQTEPPTIPIEKLFPDGHFPEGEIQEHPGDFNSFRTTSEEKRALDRAQEDLYETVRHAAEVHRHVRKFAQSLMKPGVKLIDMCTQLENKNRELVVEAGFAVSWLND